MKLKQIFLALCLVIAASNSNGQILNIQDKRLDSLLDSLYAKHQYMGALTLSQNGKVIYGHVNGFRQISKTDSIPATATTGYRVGSISKVFTSVMIFQLIQEKRLHLSDKLISWFPKVPNAGKITIANLLSHRGGLSDIKAIPGIDYWIREPHSEAEVLRVIETSAIDFQPGSRAVYSNSGYILLSYILERVAKKTYGQLLKERITEPVNLRHTYYSPKRGTKSEESFCYNYNKGWQPVPETDWSIPQGAGAIISTSQDLALFASALFNGKLVSLQSLQMMEKITDGYGMDLGIMDCPKQPAYGHTGGMDSFLSTLTYVPADGLVLAYTSNGQAMPMDELVKKIFALSYH
ncbi:serine hydrolase domain-containing protein [Pedobacter nutrimenti]|uniref:serine hydrolase domain-containing protein n=1 Tax=Pedobacter nutrimenti TaxID=1241337 RepID=UPI00292CC185|nr:serine hydrolase domain-containing protein [Pedobacter nutrimenti]